MFATATKNLLEEVDGDGDLLPVTSLNDGIRILSLVVKRRRAWLWQKNKYLPSDFILDDVLVGDTPIKPVVTETDFIKYNGTFNDNIQGNLEGDFVRAHVNMGGKDTSKLQSSLGSLKKEELDVQKLLRDSKDRVMDMSHSLVKQTMEKHREVFGVVKERIMTSQPCSVIEEVQQGGQCGGLLSLCSPRSTKVKVSIKENGSLSKDSNVTLEIPPHTALAYGLMELVVKLNGHYELCLMSDTKGGFEVDGPAKELVGLGAPVHASQHSCIKQELDRLSDHFQKLSSLPASTRSSLLQHLTKVMQDPEAVSMLETVLTCVDIETPDMEAFGTESARQNTKAILELLEQSSRGEEEPPTDKSPSNRHAVHLVISALDEMTDDGLAVLGTCCSPELLLVLELLVQCVTGSGEMSLNSSPLAPLTTEVYERIEGLFASANIALSRDTDTLKTDINQQPGYLPLVLCIAIRGLASLARSV